MAPMTYAEFFSAAAAPVELFIGTEAMYRAGELVKAGRTLTCRKPGECCA